jgi:hypothetical protein
MPHQVGAHAQLLGAHPVTLPSPLAPNADLSALDPAALQTVALSQPVLYLAEAMRANLGQGVTLAVAPLLGATPSIDRDHRRWLHVQVTLPDP